VGAADGADGHEVDADDEGADGGVLDGDLDPAPRPGEDSLARVERVFVWSAVSSSSSLKALAEEWLMVW
jgi:hypothetical protein